MKAALDCWIEKPEVCHFALRTRADIRAVSTGFAATCDMAVRFPADGEGCVRQAALAAQFLIGRIF